MYGAFQIEVIGSSQIELTKIFKEAYSTPLHDIYNASIHRDGKVFKLHEFFSGARMQNSLLLVLKLRADVLVFHVETPSDLISLKKAINVYFGHVIRVLAKHEIKWKKPEAYIYMETYTFHGTVKSIKQRLLDVWKSGWEKLILVPLSSVLASFLAVKINILNPEDYVNDVKKAMIVTGETYIGLLVVLFVALCVNANRKEFIFTI